MQASIKKAKVKTRDKQNGGRDIHLLLSQKGGRTLHVVLAQALRTGNYDQDVTNIVTALRRDLEDHFER